MRASSIISSSIGNILEWYDFGLFAIFSPIFSELFFPGQNAHVALIETFGVFAVGFFCRPLGALFFGYLGDRKGRADGRVVWTLDHAHEVDSRLQPRLYGRRI